jgi:hypothetical protein
MHVVLHPSSVKPATEFASGAPDGLPPFQDSAATAIVFEWEE